MKKLKSIITVLLLIGFLTTSKYLATIENKNLTMNATAASAGYMASKGGNEGKVFAGVAGAVGTAGSAAIVECAILAGAGPVGWVCLGVVVL